VACCGPSAAAWAIATTSFDQRGTEARRGTETTQKVAAISGKVEDPSGAVIPGATVSLTPTGAGERYETTTDTNGIYHFERVPEGSYLAVVFRDGFAPLTRELKVVPEQDATLDFQLEIASLKDEVTVAFKADKAVSTLKLDTPLADVPLAVQSYTGSFMKAIESTNVADLYNYTPARATQASTSSFGGFARRTTATFNTTVCRVLPLVSALHRPSMSSESRS
jgi:hypothetical protein